MNPYSKLLFILILCIIAACKSFQDPDAKYSYVQPLTERGLETSTLQAEGLDENTIMQMSDRIIREEFKRIDGVLILKNNKLVYEEYFHGYTKDIPHNIYSCTKSITSMLVGIAIDQKIIDTIDTPILQFFPEYTSIQNSSQWKEQITIRNLLDMNSGLDCDDWYKGSSDKMNQSTDPVKYIRDLPSINKPGTTGSYCTGGAVLLGRILENKSGMSLEAFANKNLFDPLEIKKYRWDKLQDGKSFGGGGLFLRHRDMAKIGLLMLNKGTWQSNQLISRNWVELSEKNTSKLRGPFDGYGLLWWKQNFPHNNENIEVYFSSGNGGQDIFIVPSKKMVIVMTGSNINSGQGFQNIIMLKDYIIPAIK